jgi:aminocarboxymuconate-semialdehyde decarboxylase
VIVDAHVHVIVPEITRDAAPAEDWRPHVYREDGRQVVEMDGHAIRSAVGEFVDVEAILATQDAAGVDRVVLCPLVTLLFGDASPGEALARCRIQNAALTAIVRAHPQRVSAFGAVPLQDPPLAARELDALMADGVLAGVEVPASVGGVVLGDDRFGPFWDAAERSGALVFIHPTTRGFPVPALQDLYLWNLVGNPMETTVTAAHMVLAGVLERHPRLRVLLAHAGGAVLALRGRLRHGHAVVAAAGERLHEPPEDSLRRLHYDTITHDPSLLRAVVEFAGPERVLLGSDQPFDMADQRPVETVRAAGLDPEAQAAVLGANAARLLGLEVPAR